MSLFELPDLRDTLHAPEPRVYPCRRCNHNVSVIPTRDPQRPATAICDPCQNPPEDCICERTTYNATP